MALYAILFAFWQTLFPNLGRQLYMAVCDGDAESASRLLASDAPVNWIEQDVGQSALHSAAMKGDTSIVALLLDKGAAVDLADKDGFTPIYYAAKAGHGPVLELLLARLKRSLAEATAST